MPLAHSLCAVLVAFLWGLSFVVIKLGVNNTPPLLLAAMRFFFAALPAVFFIPRPKTSWRNVVAYGFFLGVGQFGLLFAALAIGMPASLASLVMQAQVFFTILFAALVMNERPSPHQVLGSVVGFLGLCIIALPRLTGSGAAPFLMTVAAAASWGVANTISKRAGRVDMLSYIVWASLIAPLPLLGLSLWLDGPDRVVSALVHIDKGTLAAVAYLAYPSTLLAFGIWAYLLSRHAAAVVTPFALLVPVAGILGSALVLGEVMHPIEALGGAVIVLGLAFNIFGRRLLKRAA
ncbi:EamA family transporter [Microvirga calopogonii]|uniref:EamA family transporter n=1 Tax=Microvirga calopogonii TaxID=2078013 RepID=UPI000E0D1116|nr:EamA family transporter [Microvirga calopogonii]